MTIADFILSNNTGDDSFVEPFVIAEAGVNHECSMTLARRLIDEAAFAGANAIKFQTYKASAIASVYSPAYWDLSKESTKSQFELFKKYDKFWKSEFEQLKKYCDEVEIEFLSTPFDVESAKFLNDLMSVFKISSSDINNKPFIEHICSYGKPVILSTGASYMWEIEQSVEWISRFGNPMALLHCILNYPTDDKNANLNIIKTLRKKFPSIVIGYSDHTLPKDMKVLELATLLGARIIEKHFTHDKSLPGNDHYHAMDKDDLIRFGDRINKLFQLLGEEKRRPLATEEIARTNARRSLVSIRIIKAGNKIRYEDITWKRPGTGISPKNIESLVGKKVRQDIPNDSILSWDMFE
jgi:sialic acid synthase SpsE